MTLVQELPFSDLIVKGSRTRYIVECMLTRSKIVAVIELDRIGVVVTKASPAIDVIGRADTGSVRIS